MDRFAQLLVRRRRRVLAATALLSLLAIAMLTRLAFNADVTSFLTEGNERGRAFAALQQKYDASDPITILLERSDGGIMTDRDGLLLLFDTREALAATEGVASIGTLIPDSNPLTGDPITRETLERLPAPLLFAVIFLPRLAVNPDQLFFFKDNHPVRAQFARVTEAFGGATPLFGEFALDRSQELEPQLARLRELSRELEELPGVRRVFSVADAAERLPTAQRGALIDGEVTPPLGPMVSGDGLRFALFTETFTTDDLRGWLAFTDATPEVRLLTGTPLLFDELGRVVLRAQLTSLLAAFVLVGLMLLIAYRRVGQTLVALLPLLLTTAVVLAFIAASGIQLNIITAIITGIVIGVGIDYAIHLFAAIEHARPHGDGYVLRAIDVAGRPILANALGVALGMSALLISPLKPHSQVAAILWVAMLVSALSALVIIPAFMPRSGVRQAGARAEPGGAVQPPTSE